MFSFKLIVRTADLQDFTDTPKLEPGGRIDFQDNQNNPSRMIP